MRHILQCCMIYPRFLYFQTGDTVQDVLSVIRLRVFIGGESVSYNTYVYKNKHYSGVDVKPCTKSLLTGYCRQ
jgi:hypothetical protein